MATEKISPQSTMREVLEVYPGAPHSFFDVKAAQFAEASAAAWTEVLAFIRERTPVAG
jgi:carboxymethylenebutenolidase